MSLCKLRNGSGGTSAIGDDSANYTATQQALSYVRDFCQQAANYRSRQSCGEALNLLNRSASLLSTTIQPQHFNPALLEVSRFFVDLHAVMGSLAADADALWACVALLQHISRNLSARRALVDDYRFVPLLTYLLRRTNAPEKRQRLIAVLQELTYGIRIGWEEPYVIVLLEQLVNVVHSASADGEEAQVLLALSVLVNLCYKNFTVMFLLLRSVNISQFSRQIQRYGMLANKLLIILSEDTHTPDQQELNVFLRSTFAAACDCLKQWSVPQLQHIVDFLLDSQSHDGLHRAMLSYSHYCEDIERLLDQVEKHSNMNESSEELRKQQQVCLSLLFRLIRYVLELSGIPEADGSENAISLDSNVPRIYEFLRDWLESDVCGMDAVHLLDRLITTATKEPIAVRIARDPSLIAQLITISEKQEASARHHTAILQLLLTLLRQPKTEKLILSKITESYFDKVLTPLVGANAKADASAADLSLDDIEKSAFCLLLLINFGSIAKKAYFEKCCTLLQLPRVQNALARTMLSGNGAACSAVFEISQFEHFPQTQVVKEISRLSCTNKTTTNATADMNGGHDQWCNLNTILKSQKTFIGKEVEERLNALIEVIGSAQSSNQLNNIATSQIIELFNYKIEKLSSAESNMQRRLENASQEITDLTQRLNLQNAELQKYHMMNFQLHINQESLKTQCGDLQQQKNNLKRNMTDLMKKLSEQAESLQINEKRLSVKVSEVIVLHKENNELKESFLLKSKELEHLQANVKENATRIDKLKKTIGAFELDKQEQLRNIDEKERELCKTQKALDEQREAKKKSDGVIAVLEAQLQEKNEQIRNYELELSETEELRKTIMSLMESKKPKRKPN